MYEERKCFLLDAKEVLSPLMLLVWEGIKTLVKIESSRAIYYPINFDAFVLIFTRINMCYHSHFITLFTSLLLLTNIQFSWAKPTDEEQKFKEEFSLALKYVRASYTDSAKILLNQLIQKLSDRDEINTNLGLLAKLHLANILIPEREDFASKELINLIGIGTDWQEWEVVAHAHILLGMIHETLGAKESCEHHLDQAAFLIKKYKLDELYPRYAIGRSSYFRVFDLNQDSALFYAREALNNVPSEPSESKAAAYYLVGLLLRDSSYTRQIAYLGKSAEAYLELGDYFGHTSKMNNITKQVFGSSATG